MIEGAVAAGEVVRIVRVRSDQALDVAVGRLAVGMLGEVALGDPDRVLPRVCVWIRPAVDDGIPGRLGLTFYREQLERVSVDELRVQLLACLGLRYFLQTVFGPDKAGWPERLEAPGLGASPERRPPALGPISDKRDSVK